jgi:hypothetical protein
MSALTLDRRLLMSALPPKADIAERRLDVRFVPKADSRTAAKDGLFDHLVGGGSHFGGIVRPSTFAILRLIPNSMSTSNACK